jgi:hypothetical protein
MQAVHPDLSGCPNELRDGPLPNFHGAPLLHRLHRSVLRPAFLGGHAVASAEAMKDANDKPPYRRWHTVCAVCGKVTLARPCRVPGEIEPVEPNPVVKCQRCEDTRQYLTSACFLAPLSAASSDRTGGPSPWWLG